jgi:hypothetical protein
MMKIFGAAVVGALLVCYGFAKWINRRIERSTRRDQHIPLTKQRREIFVELERAGDF